MKYIYWYLLTVPVFFGLDMVWLGLISKDFYRKNLLGIMSENINWTAAIVFYLIYIIGILIFAALPAVKGDSLSLAILYGALFGFFAYATYDLTNLATIKGWPLSVTLVDLVWGAVLSAAVSAAAYFIGKWLL